MLPLKFEIFPHVSRIAFRLSILAGSDLIAISNLTPRLHTGGSIIKLKSKFFFASITRLFLSFRLDTDMRVGVGYAEFSFSTPKHNKVTENKNIIIKMVVGVFSHFIALASHRRGKLEIFFCRRVCLNVLIRG